MHVLRISISWQITTDEQREGERNGFMRYVNDAIKKHDTPKDEQINRIIELEWTMFDQVTNTGGRAACQDDEWTFYVMRFSQFSAFDESVLQSYEQDLLQAQQEGRNVVTEKYGYMMEYTDPAYFDQKLKPVLPQISAAKGELVDRIVNLLLGFEKVFDQRYPALYSRSRPLQGAQAGNVSFHLYTIGELKTYSRRTLEIYYRQLAGIDPQDEKNSPSFVIHRMTTAFYGYASLEEAEARIRNGQ